MAQLRRLLFLLVALVLAEASFADLIEPAPEKRSLAKVGDELWLAANLNAPHITLRGYVLRLDLRSGEWGLESFKRPVLSIAQSDSTVWLGTYGDGLFQLTGDSRDSFTVATTGFGDGGEHESLRSDYVNSVVPRERQVFCATGGGLSIYDVLEGQWVSFDTANSPLPANTVFALDEREGQLWMTASNYGELYYEGEVVGNERGSLLSYDLISGSWRTHTGVQKRIGPGGHSVALRGDMPAPNSDFRDVIVSPSGDVWFSYAGGVGRLRHDVWTLFDSRTSGINFRNGAQIAVQDGGVWVGTGSQLWRYEEADDAWTVYQAGSDKIPGDYVVAVYVTDSTLWIKSRGRIDSGEGWGAELDRRRQLKENTTALQQALYDPRHVEYLTRYEGGRWESWELTAVLLGFLAE
ncbi:MAG TPA: hypothetical protein VM118_11540 [Acidobacteriota bacterium]|nr:hypothetical protein [Acidobacteriota bacterium]